MIEHYQPWEQDKELTASLQAYRVTVNVGWEHAGRSRQITFNSVRLKKVETTDIQG